MDGHIRILIVEDDIVTRRALARSLQIGVASIELIESSDGKEATELLLAQEFDCAFLDHRLPGQDGLSILQSIRGAGRQTPVVMITGVGSEEFAVEAMKAGATDYIPKSRLSSERVLQSLRYVRRIHEAERNAAAAINERRLAQEAQRRSEERLRKVFEEGPIGMALVGLDGRIQEVNSALCRMLGFSSQELRQLGVPAITHPEDSHADAECRTRLFSGQISSYTIEKRYRTRSGNYIWGCLTASLVRDDSGQPLYAIGIIENINDRKQAEEALRQTNQMLEALIRGSPVAIIVMNIDGVVKMWNPAAERMFGWTAEETIGNLLPMIPNDRAAEFEALRLRVLSGETLVGVELQRQRKGGSSIDVSVALAPLRDTAGQITGAVSISQDITESKTLKERLLQAQRMESIGRLAGGVAHDFNNLLAVISGYSEALLRHLGEDRPWRHHVEEIEKAAQRGATLTRQLLAFSRRQVLVPQLIDLNDIVAGMNEMLRGIIGDEIRIVTGRDEHLRPVRADPAQIEQIVMNLAINARDAMPQGGMLTIETQGIALRERAPHKGLSPGNYVRLAVTDTGCGMDSQIQARIFEPFFTTKQGKGTGLGLSIVYGIVQESGGSMCVHSEPEKGTTFEVFFPAV